MPLFSEISPKNVKDIKINESNKKFAKVLEGGELENKSKIDEGLDLSNILEDVFKLEELPQDTVRLSASTIEQLLKIQIIHLMKLGKAKKSNRLDFHYYRMKLSKLKVQKKKNLFIKNHFTVNFRGK